MGLLAYVFLVLPSCGQKPLAEPLCLRWPSCLPGSMAMGGEGVGRKVGSASAALFFLVDLSAMSTDHLSWKVVFALFQVRILLPGGPQEDGWVGSQISGFLCLVMMGCGTLPPFSPILWPCIWTQPQCVPATQALLLSLLFYNLPSGSCTLTLHCCNACWGHGECQAASAAPMSAFPPSNLPYLLW